MPRDFESGSSQYLTLASQPTSDVPFSVSAWVKPESFTANMGILGIYANDADNHYHMLRIGGTGGTKMQASSAAGGTDANAVSTGSMSAGNWYFGGATFGPTAGTDRRVTLRALGGAAEQVSNTTNRVAITHRAAIGARWSVTPALFMDGLIAHAAWWNVQLSDGEMIALSFGAHPFQIRPGALIGYWPLWGKASPEPDETKGRFPATLVAAPAQGAGGPPVAPFFVDFAYMPFVAAGGTTFPQELTATAGTTATMSRSVGKIMSATAGTTATIVKQVGKTVTASAVSTTATMTRQVGKTLSASVGTAATMTAIRVFLVTMSATVATAATMSRQVGKNVTAAVGTTATMTRQVAKTVTAAVGTTAAITKQIAKTLTAAAGTIASLATVFIPAGGVAAVVKFFARPTPGGGVGDGGPAGGVGEGTPDASRFDDPTPGQTP